MLDMLSHPRRPLSGHLMCYLNRTYHVLPTPRAEPACALPLLRLVGARSSASGLPAEDHRPRLRCVAGAVHPTRPLSPVWVARTRHAPGRLADSAGWSATPSSESNPRSWRPAGPSVPRPFAARLVRAARFARAATRSAAGAATPDVPVSIVEPEIAPSCPSYKLRHGCQQVSTCITVYVVSILEPEQVATATLPAEGRLSKVRLPSIGLVATFVRERIAKPSGIPDY